MEEHSKTATRELDTPRQQTIQRREWIAERIGWVLMAVVLFAASLGWLGPGLFSSRVVRSSDGLMEVEYDAIERYDAPCKLTIHLHGASKHGALVAVGCHNEVHLYKTADKSELFPPVNEEKKEEKK